MDDDVCVEKECCTGARIYGTEESNTFCLVTEEIKGIDDFDTGEWGGICMQGIELQIEGRTIRWVFWKSKKLTPNK